MKRVTSAARVRALDQATIDDLGVPGHTLMELAGHAAAASIHRRWPDAPVGVLCGPGNNGGDGYVVARWLHLWGHPVRLWASGVARSDDARRNASLCDRMGIRPTRGFREALGGAEVVVDALLGTGQASAPRSAIGKAIQAIHEARADTGAAVVSLDLPTGLCGDTGQVLGELAEHAVQAHVTVTFGFAKPGFYAMPGARFSGEVEVVDLGLQLGLLAEGELPGAEHWLLEPEDLPAFEPSSDPGQAKWNRGHVAVFGRRGASVLTAHGAFAAGCGLVSLLQPEDQWAHLHGLRPEVILAPESAYNPGRHDVVVVGPALGRGQDERVRSLWGTHPGPLVADADALSVLAEAPPPAGVEGIGARVITPHSAEAARLLGCSRDEVDADRFSAARALAERYACIAVLKGPFSLIAGPSEPTRINPTGSVALATAGTGDVLAGLIAGHLARAPHAPLDAACLAVWRHGAAGEGLPSRGTASDLVSALRHS